MKLQRLLIASAVCAAFGGTAYAQQQQDPQQTDPAQQQQDQQAEPAQQQQQESTQQQDSMQQGGNQQVQMDEQTVRQVQQKLKDAGYDVGKVDGKWGPRSNAALQKFQEAQGIQSTGQLDQQTLSALGIQGGSETFAEQPEGATSDPAATPESGASQPGGATDPGATDPGATGGNTGAGGGAAGGAGGGNQ